MKLLLVTILALPLLITACGSKEETQTEIHTEMLSEKKLNKKPNIESIEAMPYQSPGKPSAPISLEYNLVNKPVLGQPLAVNIKLTETRDGKAVKAKLKYSPELIENQAINEMAFEPSPANADQTVTVTPVENGIYFINIQASTEVDGQIMYKSFSIPIEVGNVDWAKHTKPEGNLSNNSEAGKVISFPAAEY